MHTEEQAKRLWCPFARAQGIGAELSHNRPDSSYNCIASECMAWRWGEQGHDAGDFPNTAEHESTGYCGLAGKPS